MGNPVEESENKRRIFAEERRQQIIALLGKDKKIVVPELCNHFGVSASTIRNDLRELEEADLIKRTHGGAICKTKVNLEPLPADKEAQMLGQKEAIAHVAADLVDDGDTIAICTGTTTLEFAKKLLAKKNITVVTNDIRIAAYLEERSDFTLFMVGGIIRRGFHYVNATGTPLPRVAIDKIFFSCNGLNAAMGATVPDYYLAADINSLIRLASECVLLCDSSKVGSIAFAQIVPLAAINTIVIDDAANPADIKELQAQESCNIIIAPMRGVIE
jgi:DeoR family transcriptional regulator, fructose operon transcriptional repressor